MKLDVAPGVDIQIGLNPNNIIFKNWNNCHRKRIACRWKNASHPAFTTYKSKKHIYTFFIFFKKLFF
jgi:hypothetical protein